MRIYQIKVNFYSTEDAVELIADTANWLYSASNKALTDAIRNLCKQSDSLEDDFEKLSSIMGGKHTHFLRKGSSRNIKIVQFCLVIFNILNKYSFEFLAILYALCLVIAVIAVVEVGIIAFTMAVISAAIEGVWEVIKEVTGFVWKVFVATVKSRYFWGAVATAGAGIAFVNPFVGAIVGGIGVIGTIATS